MNLPVDFIFSQGSLQDFNECRRRFFLRYIQKLAWPAPPAEPYLEFESAMQRGARFHQIIHQYLAGCPAERIDALLTADPELAAWWRNFLTFFADLELGHGQEKAQIFTEHSLATVMEERRFLAKYDLLIIFPTQKCWIVDWKTGRQKPGASRRLRLEKHWQTNLYPWILLRTASAFGIPSLQAEDIEMLYWFASDPTHLERFSFSRTLYENIEDNLMQIINHISEMGESDFEKTPDDRQCVYCSYRSLCDRGVTAGVYQSAESDLLNDSAVDMAFDFSKIAELPYQSL